MKKALLLLTFILLGFSAYAQQNTVSKFTNPLQTQTLKVSNHKVAPNAPGFHIVVK